MKIGYFGTPEHSAKLLQALVDSKLVEVLFVVTNPDRPKGRSRIPEAGPVKKKALEYNLPVFQYESIKKEKKKLSPTSVYFLQIFMWFLLMDLFFQRKYIRIQL